MYICANRYFPVLKQAVALLDEIVTRRDKFATASVFPAQLRTHDITAKWGWMHVSRPNIIMRRAQGARLRAREETRERRSSSHARRKACAASCHRLKLQKHDTNREERRSRTQFWHLRLAWWWAARTAQRSVCAMEDPPSYDAVLEASQV